MQKTAKVYIRRILCCMIGIILVGVAFTLYANIRVECRTNDKIYLPVSFTHIRAHETKANLVSRVVG